jgi:hypothetical protein
MDQGSDRTKLLLACGAIAGPLFAVVALLQAFTRAGFDLTRQQLSLLSNGDLGWIQIANFAITGLLFASGAVGMSRVQGPGPARRWGPRLIGIFGLSLIAASAFRADAAFGFPPGTPAGPPAAISWHGGLHLLVAGIGFLALVVAAFAFGRRFAQRGRGLWAVWSFGTGALFLIAIGANGAMAGQAAANVGFTAMALLAFLWASAVATSLLTEQASRGGASRIAGATV